MIKTAECGSLTRAAQALGYTQPSLGYIINNIESDLGVKIFYRDQRGVTLTKVGQKMLEVMKRIEATEEELRQIAQVSKGDLLRVGIFPSVATQWLPGILSKFYQDYPDAIVRLEHEADYLQGEMGVKSHHLDCCFFTGKCPPGLDIFPLYEDPYCLVVNERNPLARKEEISVEEIDDRVPFIPTSESFDQGSALRDIYQSLTKGNRLDFQPQENQTAIAMIEQDLGITILPLLTLLDFVPSRKIKIIPLKGKYARTISLLCPRDTERSPLTSAFLSLTQRRVAQWKTDQETLRSGNFYTQTS